MWPGGGGADPVRVDAERDIPRGEASVRSISANTSSAPGTPSSASAPDVRAVSRELETASNWPGRSRSGGSRRSPDRSPECRTAGRRSPGGQHAGSGSSPTRWLPRRRVRRPRPARPPAWSSPAEGRRCRSASTTRRTSIPTARFSQAAREKEKTTPTVRPTAASASSRAGNAAGAARQSPPSGSERQGRETGRRHSDSQTGPAREDRPRTRKRRGRAREPGRRRRPRAPRRPGRRAGPGAHAGLDTRRRRTRAEHAEIEGDREVCERAGAVGRHGGGEQVQREEAAGHEHAHAERDPLEEEAAGHERNGDDDGKDEIGGGGLDPDDRQEQDAERDSGVVARERQGKRPEEAYAEGSPMTGTGSGDRPSTTPTARKSRTSAAAPNAQANGPRSKRRRTLTAWAISTSAPQPPGLRACCCSSRSRRSAARSRTSRRCCRRWSAGSRSRWRLTAKACCGTRPRRPAHASFHWRTCGAQSRPATLQASSS